MLFKVCLLLIFMCIYIILLCCFHFLFASYRGGDPDFNFSRHISGKHDVRNLLPDMHPVSDRKDICPPKFGYNFSKIQHKEPELRTTIVDFLNPKDVTHERKIGYAPGHIRTILQLDTFGPAHSDEVNEKRMSGKLPMSPNLDRNAVLTPDISRIGSCKSGGGDRYDNDDGSSGFWGGEEDVSLGSPGSRTSSINNRIKKQTYVPGGTWNAELLNATLHDKTQPLVRPSTSGYKQDARGTNKNYSRDRTAMIKEKELQRLRTAELRKDRNRQKKESEEYQRLINDFEAHLKSIQY